jgi:tetratricopeptide (TPR) repeat protein
MKAWQFGAKEWRENLAKKQAVLYPLHDAWKTYQPVGYASVATDIKIPPEDKLVAAYTADLGAFLKSEMGDQETVLLAAVKKATATADKSKTLNNLGILYARYGMYDQAITQFKQVIAKDEFVPALVNLGNIYFLKSDDDNALVYYNRAVVKAPKNAVALLGVARANHALENYSIAKKAYSDLKVLNPDLAGKFAYLDLRGEESTRAAEAAGTKGSVQWADK